MPAPKIQNEQEVIRWFEEGRTYAWMSDQYRKKYNIEMSASAWGSFRARRGLEPRLVRDDDLIPWAVEREHRWAYPLAMLRVEARRRAGHEVRELDAKRLASWKADLEEHDAVVHYDPETDEGFHYVPRRQGIDTDLIRKPDRKTTPRRSRQR